MKAVLPSAKTHEKRALMITTLALLSCANESLPMRGKKGAQEIEDDFERGNFNDELVDYEELKKWIQAQLIRVKQRAERMCSKCFKKHKEGDDILVVDSKAKKIGFSNLINWREDYWLGLVRYWMDNAQTEEDEVEIRPTGIHMVLNAYPPGFDFHCVDNDNWESEDTGCDLFDELPGLFDVMFVYAHALMKCIVKEKLYVFEADSSSKRKSGRRTRKPAPESDSDSDSEHEEKKGKKKSLRRKPKKETKEEVVETDSEISDPDE